MAQNIDKILIVDDSQADRELFREILLSSNVPYEITMADSGRMALAEVDKDAPDLILLDIKMADLDGFQTLRELNNKENPVPVILISSFTGENDRLRGLELGATDFINKPIISEEVKARVAVQMRIKKILDDAQWVAQKTNKGIKLLYKDLEKKNDELKELDQLKSDFISMVSHELRTPLAIIRQGVSLLQRKIVGDVNEKQLELLGDVVENIDRLVKIINDLLDISKLEARKLTLERSAVDSLALIRAIVALFQMKAQAKGIALLTDLPDALPPMDADEDRIIQVLTNLLANAIKFTPEQGRVTVSAKEKGDFLEVAVSDTGVGIAQENLSKLFDKFQQFGRKSGPGEQGTGLGLAICKEIVRLHGGEICAESVMDKGSTFYFTIPQMKFH
jgi:signal transduction histidine kinase